MSSTKRWILLGSLAAVLSAAAGYAVSRYRHGESSSRPPAAWNSNAIKATFAGIQVREIDSTNAEVIFFYDLENTTDFDYRIDNGPKTNFLSRLKSDGSLSSEEQPRLDHPAFLPARHRTHIGLELVRPFQWPAQNGAASDQQFREFVKRQTSNLEGFVLFDENTRYEVDLRGGWPDLEQSAMHASAN
jgi:hypothetical protein